MLLIIVLIALCVLPGIIVIFLLTKNYFIGLTDGRLIVLQVKGMKPNDVKEVTEYSFSELSSANASNSTGSLFTHITIKGHRNNRPLNANGFAVGDKGNTGIGWGHISAASPSRIGRYLYCPVVTGTVYVIDTEVKKTVAAGTHRRHARPLTLSSVRYLCILVPTSLISMKG